MKLDGELAFCHSNIDLEPENQSFEFDDSDLESAGCKSGDWKVKKNENKIPIDLERNEGDSEADFKDFVEPIPHPSHDVESFENSSNAVISDPPKETESLENSSDIYTDKRVTEYVPGFTVCYKESDYHMIKDICIDEGVPAKDKILFENSADEVKFLPSESKEDEELMKDNIKISVPFPATEETDKVSANHCDSKVLIQRDNEEAAEKPDDNAHKEMVLPGDKILLQDLLDREKSRPSIDKGEGIEHNNEQVSGEPQELRNKIEEAVLASPSKGDSKPENGSIPCEFDPSACSKQDCDQVGGCKCGEPQNMPVPANGQLDRQSLGESSFSAIGAVSSRISYSGPVPYSGSISLRSDSSTTSTRSFAFPIMQSEWNSSPVRMAKADRRHYRKHRGWRQGLCCRF
ncbi:hypothetical protein L6164_026993 [Bauhinia variegata]|uniref:Uncharacterized protein n=1 Tax=Bauhinia variegata TaxID=167791 RepID=A0ACB9LRK9_BAUVA|nr:hypothetical protein L6164_026993 [Bauhinia variegata]